MGLSVSASAGVVFLGVFLAVGIAYPAAANGFERVTDARGDAADRALERANTDVEVTNATYFEANETLVVRADNDGTTSVGVEDATLFVDNVIPAAANTTVTVEGDGDTGLWLPGETARFEVDLAGEPTPERAQVVVDHGVRDASEVGVN
ncbi:flagellin [Halobaculum sp. CBA1158]|uniref:flagellin n=1 Tax=Halobaculum sp. CBA1158 TaxID=2904243 RepID=UPI001F42BE9D|nr:flagellin [Halobaculum sp. CBA1158]UIP00044.1 flagellin [Halobaculum sp. CBA1158]